MHSNPEISQWNASNISVIVRVRGLLECEKDSCSHSSLERIDSRTALIRNIADADEIITDDRRSNRRSHDTDKIFVFDHVFDSSANQQDVFEVTGSSIVDSVLEGVNATVFAYGATSAGKTYTMLGTDEDPGLMMLTIDALFQRIGPESSFHVRSSFVEIYNEVVRDLLSVSEFMETGLEIRDDPLTGQTYVHGACEVSGIRDSEDMMELLQLGNTRRTTEPTAANETSSRSHAILQIYIERTDPETNEVIHSKLSLIDLAGSERARNTQNRGQRMTEGGSINKSLLALGNCIKALTSTTNPTGFVPFRDSKLTRLLRDSLGGNCRTVMIANVSPYAGHYTDSLNTLKFAIGAKNVPIRLRRNSFFKTPHDEIQSYKRIISELESTVGQLREQIRSSPLPTPTTTTNTSGSPMEFQVFTDDEDDDRFEKNTNQSLLVNQCLGIAKEILREKLYLAPIQSPPLARQPSLIRNKSVVSLRGTTPQLDSYNPYSNLESLRDNLLLISRSIAVERVSHPPPILANATITSGDWQPKLLSTKQPLKVSLLPNTLVSKRKQRSNSFSSSRSSSGISFN